MRHYITAIACLSLTACATAARELDHTKPPPTLCERAQNALADAISFEAFAISIGNLALSATARTARVAAEATAASLCPVQPSV